MKIVYCIFDCSSSGGPERALSLQANYFAGKGNEVHIVTTEKPSCKQNSYIFSDNISFHNLSINYREVDNSLSPLKIIYRIKKGHKHKQQLAKLLFALKPDFTIGMFGHDSSFLYKINDGSKKILEYHFSRYHRKIEFASAIFWKRWFALLREWRKCKFINKYDAFIVLTQQDAKNWKDIKKLYVIPNALPFIPQQISTCENKKAISVGRLSPEKGYDLLIKAWKLVTERHPDWELEIYGDGQEKSKLYSIISEYSLSNISINAPIRNIEDKYTESSIYLMSSHYEGFGIVLIEAMACGLPCVSFNCPYGPSEILTDNENGFLIPINDIYTLADKVCILIEKEEMRKKMGHKAYIAAMQYSPIKVMKKWEKLFDDLKKK